MRLRWILPLCAVLFVGGALWITQRARGVTPETLLASARARLAATPPERARALRELDEAFRLTVPGQRELRAELLHERSVLFQAQGFNELALEDCRLLLAELGADAEALSRASELCLELGEPVPALEHATALVALDPGRGHALVGRSRVALADAPLSALERMARTALPLQAALQASALAQRAAVFAADEAVSTAAQEEMLALFQRDDERRLASEWVREAADHLELARTAFVESLSPGGASAAVAGLQDLFLRGGAPREAADLGRTALALPKLPDPMPVLARTASAYAALGRLDSARALVLRVQQRNPAALRPHLLPSSPLRDELKEWCVLLERLALWSELRAAAYELLLRSQGDKPLNQLATYLVALGDVRTNQIGSAHGNLERLGTSIVPDDDLPVRVWSLRAEVARHQRQSAAERYALLQTTKSAGADPKPELRAEVGRAWERMAQLQMQGGERGAAEISLTHALRLSPQRAASLEKLWHQLGSDASGPRAASSPYALWSRARYNADRESWTSALADARAVLEDFPGLGPALEIVSEAAEALRDYPLLISSALELIERGWPPDAASARLRRTPPQYFLAQDRLRWMQLDPRASLERVLRRLLERGDVAGAAMAARAEPAARQPIELLPLLARVELDAGLPAVALETIALLPEDSDEFRASTGLALRAALARAPTTQEPVLERELERVLASGVASDPGLVTALDMLLAAGRTGEAARVLEWLAPQTPPFLAEVLLRGAVLRALTVTGGASAAALDEDLERATALLDDGRPELGRLVHALALGDEAGITREAHALLATPFPATEARRAALLVLAGDRSAAEALVADVPRDGRDPLLELAADAHAAGEDPALWTAPLSASELLVLGLASETRPYGAWVLGRTAALEQEVRADPAVRVFRARAWLALGLAEPALPELGPSEEPPSGVSGPDPRIAWLRARVQEARRRPAEAVLAAEVAWFQIAGVAPEEPWLARLAAEAAARGGDPGLAAERLVQALERWPDDPVLLRALAEVESVPGRRARAADLYARLLAALPEEEAGALVLPFLDVLRAGRDAGELSEARWWSEVEALEAERPIDPAPVRELAARALERPEAASTGTDGTDVSGRLHALARLDRFRARIPDRSLESLRRGEGQRWVELLARYVPERARVLAESELRRDTDDPVLWRASGEALLATGRWREALARLEALQRVAPERETARLFALTSYRIEQDAKEFLERVAALERIDPESRRDPLLAFYKGLASAAAGARTKAETLSAHTLWQARATNGLDDPEHGRALALATFEAGRTAPALVVLGEAFLGAHGALEGDLFEALGNLMRSALPPKEAPKAEDVPADGAADAPATDEPAAADPLPE